MKSYHIIAIVVACVALLWIGSGFIFPGDDPADESKTPAQSASSSDEKDEPFQVRVQSITAQDYTDDVIFTGRSQASSKVVLKAETPGQIQSIGKEEGQAVEKDDVLATIDVQDRASRVDEAKQRVSQRTIEYEAARNLSKEGFGSKVRLAQSRADLENARSVLKDAQNALGNTQLKAPFAGTIAAQMVETGDYVSVGTEAFTLVNLSPIEFAGYVSEKRIADLSEDQDAYALVLNGQEIKGKVTYIAPAADPATRTFRVLVSAPNENSVIRDGLTAKIRIPARKVKAYKISPSILSLNDDGTIGLKFVDEQNTVQFSPITILADTPDAMWVMSDTIPETVTIITVGQDFVATGQTVDPVMSKGDGLL